MSGGEEVLEVEGEKVRRWKTILLKPSLRASLPPLLLSPFEIPLFRLKIDLQTLLKAQAQAFTE